MLFKMNMEIPNPMPKKKQPDIYPLPYVPAMNPYSAMGYSGVPMVPGLTPINPIVKRYNITVNNMQGDISKVGDLYEDILPPKVIAQNNRFSTIYERKVLYDYIKPIIVKHGSGEKMHSNVLYRDDHHNPNRIEIESLLSHISVMDINPYHFSHITNNPYRTMPDDMIMFKSCYPIQYNNMLHKVQCSPDSISLHLRIYLESYYDKLASKRPDIFPKFYSNLWRELGYYEYIRDEIIKKNVSPNFVVIYKYYITKNTSILFKKLNKLKEDSFNDIKKKLKDNHQDYSDANNIPLTHKENIDIDAQLKNDPTTLALFDEVISNKNSIKGCIVAITEGPTYNILDWCSRAYSYEFFNPIKKQIITGVHSIDEWMSVSFQLFSAILVMNKHKFLFKEFCLENNVYIKDLKLESNDIGYWKYVIDGISYYIPNMGYLVMIDSNYKDVDQMNIRKVPINKDLTSTTPKILLKFNVDDFKIRSRIYDIPGGIDDNKLNQKDYIKNNIRNFANMLNDVTYSIPDEVKKIYDDFTSDNNSLNLFILKKFSRFLHNRVGTVLKDYETKSLIQYSTSFDRGELVAYKSPTSSNYIVSIYLTSIANNSNNNCKIFTNISNTSTINLDVKPINNSEIKKLGIVLEQSYKHNQRFKPDELLETYYIN